MPPRECATRMTKAIPVSTFSGVLEQIDGAKLSPENRGAIDDAFPAFLYESSGTDLLREHGINWMMTAYQPRPTGWGRLRRYAGSRDFGHTGRSRNPAELHVRFRREPGPAAWKSRCHVCGQHAV